MCSNKTSLTTDHLPRINPSAVPAHLAIIMDGNGRWAKARGLPRTAGHKRGAEALREMVEVCPELGVEYLTVYAFSSENWKRDPEEVTDLMQLLRWYLQREIKTLHKNNIRVRVIGDRARLATDIQQQIQDAEALTQANTRFNLTVALGYGSRLEWVRATQAIAEHVKNGALQPEDINEQALAQALYTHDLPDPDLLIRTGGEQRLSNFLLWQMAYTELYFTDILWPDFNRATLEEAIAAFAGRERRFGGV